MTVQVCGGEAILRNQSYSDEQKHTDEPGELHASFLSAVETIAPGSATWGEVRVVERSNSRPEGEAGQEAPSCHPQTGSLRCCNRMANIGRT
jgi:hypothetical protein